jgi:hypothetical protein
VLTSIVASKGAIVINGRICMLLLCAFALTKTWAFDLTMSPARREKVGR